MNETTNFISENAMNFKEIDVEKTKLFKICQKKKNNSNNNNNNNWNGPKDWQIIENLVDRHEQYSRRNCLLVHGIAETNDENTDDLVLKTMNEKLDVDVTEIGIDRSYRIGRKKDGQITRPIIVRLTRYSPRKNVFTSKTKLKGSGVKRMKKAKKNTVLPICGSFFNRPNVNKNNLLYD